MEGAQVDESVYYEELTHDGPCFQQSFSAGYLVVLVSMHQSDIGKRSLEVAAKTQVSAPRARGLALAQVGRCSPKAA